MFKCLNVKGAGWAERMHLPGRLKCYNPRGQDLRWAEPSPWLSFHILITSFGWFSDVFGAFEVITTFIFVIGGQSLHWYWKTSIWVFSKVALLVQIFCGCLIFTYFCEQNILSGTKYLGQNVPRGWFLDKQNLCQFQQEFQCTTNSPQHSQSF